MKWRTGRRSRNVIDARGRSGFRPGRGGLRLGGRRGGGIGIVGLLIVLGIGLLFGVDPLTLLAYLSGGGEPQVEQVPGGQAPDGQAPVGQAQGPVSPRQEEIAQFVSVVLADTEDTWPAVLEAAGLEAAGGAYREPSLVLFSGAVGSACGLAQSAIGPFYCPGDERIYLDTRFFDELARGHGAPGDFAQAYVIAHEIGHHVQRLTGVLEQVRQAQRGLGEAEANALQVRVELQADCYAGLWAHHAQRARNILEPGDLEEALRAAAAIGDDTLQRRGQGYVVPDSFTHGSSEQRSRWFRRGFEGGGLESCDTFGAAGL